MLFLCTGTQTKTKRSGTRRFSKMVDHTRPDQLDLVWAFISNTLTFLFHIVPSVRSSADRKVCFYIFFSPCASNQQYFLKKRGRGNLYLLYLSMINAPPKDTFAEGSR
ncbi:unnamed protein product [Ixodes persulcatus]